MVDHSSTRHPFRTCSDLLVGARRSKSAHIGSPSAVMNDTTRCLFDNATASSGKFPKTSMFVTVLPRSRCSAASQRASSLQLPQTIELVPSILQLHSTIAPNSPSDSIREPCLRARCTNVPNSRKIAEPCPRQACVRCIPTRISR